jgi:hypothetical protein
MADGSEPFSMIYDDVVSARAGAGWDVGTVAPGLTKLVADGLIEPTEVLPGAVLHLDAEALEAHYADLEWELVEAARPFYYSRGECFFQLTTAGRTEWGDEQYRPYFTDTSG